MNFLPPTSCAPVYKMYDEYMDIDTTSNGIKIGDRVTRVGSDGICDEVGTVTSAKLEKGRAFDLETIMIDIDHCGPQEGVAQAWKAIDDNDFSNLFDDLDGPTESERPARKSRLDEIEIDDSEGLRAIHCPEPTPEVDAYEVGVARYEAAVDRFAAAMESTESNWDRLCREAGIR